MRILSIFDFTHFFMVFMLLIYLEALLKASINEFEISINSSFLDSRIYIFLEKKNVVLR
jgi:hypothetical protein